MSREKISREGDDEHEDAPEQHEAFKMIIGPRVIQLLRDNPLSAQHDPECQCFCSFEMFLWLHPRRTQRIAYLWELILRRDNEKAFDAIMEKAKQKKEEFRRGLGDSPLQSA